jgi:hypothetical protein
MQMAIDREPFQRNHRRDAELTFQALHRKFVDSRGGAYSLIENGIVTVANPHGLPVHLAAYIEKRAGFTDLRISIFEQDNTRAEYKAGYLIYTVRMEENRPWGWQIATEDYSPYTMERVPVMTTCKNGKFTFPPFFKEPQNFVGWYVMNRPEWRKYAGTPHVAFSAYAHTQVAV